MTTEDRHAWIDASAGVAGDMLLGALLDAGASLTAVQEAVDAVIPDSVQVGVAEVDRAGLRATKAELTLTAADQPHRSWRDVRGLLTDATLTSSVRARATAVFARLAEAEGAVHGIAAEDVHFHEVGALDSIADIVGVSAAIADLGIASVSAGPVAVGPAGSPWRTARWVCRSRPWSSWPAAGGFEAGAAESWRRRPGWPWSSNWPARARTCRSYWSGQW